MFLMYLLGQHFQQLGRGGIRGEPLGTDLKGRSRREGIALFLDQDGRDAVGAVMYS